MYIPVLQKYLEVNTVESFQDNITSTHSSTNIKQLTIF